MTSDSHEINIEIFPWNKNFETGHELIDEQHKELVRLVNHLAICTANPEQSDCLGETFDRLVEYAGFHFKAEEELIDQFISSETLARDHKAEHSAFVEHILSIRPSETDGPGDSAAAEKLLSFLTRWLANHILEKDRETVFFIQALQSGKSVEEARHMAAEQMSGTRRVLIDAVLNLYQYVSASSLRLVNEVHRRLKIERKLRQISAGFENSLEQIVITDDELRVIEANRAFCSAVDEDYDRALFVLLAELKPGLQNHQNLEPVLVALEKNSHWFGEIFFRDKTGKKQTEWLSVSLIKDLDAGRLHIIWLFSSISQLITRQQSLEHAALHDHLTGLPNRLRLYDRLMELTLKDDLHNGQDEVHNGHDVHFALCFIDLDGFKEVNDNLGHATGDLLLKALAERMRLAAAGKGMVSRLSGDEFVVLFETDDQPGRYRALAEGLAEKLARPVEPDHEIRVTVTASIGVAVYPADSNNYKELLEFADRAMYRAKELGKDRVVFYSELDG